MEKEELPPRGVAGRRRVATRIGVELEEQEPTGSSNQDGRFAKREEGPVPTEKVLRL